MKRVIGLLLSLICLLSVVAIPASAITSGSNVQTSTSVEYLDDGSYFVIETVQTSPNVRSTKSGSKTATHYGANGAAIWRVTVQGTFTYTSGVSAKATSASATVGIIDKTATFVEKDAYTSGASAYGYGKIKYDGVPFVKTVVLTCDKYGNLS